MSDPRSMEQAAVEAARLGGKLLGQRFRAGGNLEIREKGFHDFVTEVDQASEAALTGYLKQRFPDHAIMAEEGSPREEREEFRWIIDPLDGTTNFIHGIPMFGLAKPPTRCTGDARADGAEPQAIVSAVAHHKIAANAEQRKQSCRQQQFPWSHELPFIWKQASFPSAI